MFELECDKNIRVACRVEHTHEQSGVFFMTPCHPVMRHKLRWMSLRPVFSCDVIKAFRPRASRTSGLFAKHPWLNGRLPTHTKGLQGNVRSGALCRNIGTSHRHQEVVVTLVYWLHLVGTLLIFIPLVCHQCDVDEFH